jgi:cyclase
VADPVEMARMYNAAGADELVFYDITASFEHRALFTDILTQVAREIFIPLTVGGGINTLDDFDRVLKCGADKVSVNSGALRDPELISAAAQRYGNQCVVLSADVKRVDGQFRVFAKGGREDTGRDALDWLAEGVARGAGEICLNSIDTDGVRDGFDLELLDAAAARVNVPIIASGGAGKKEDFLELFGHKGIDAGLAAGIFHQKLLSIRELKEYLRANGVEMRL